MSEQVLMPMIGTDSLENKERAQNSLEKARIAHEKYLIGKEIMTCKKQSNIMSMRLNMTQLYLKLTIVWRL